MFAKCQCVHELRRAPLAVVVAVMSCGLRNTLTRRGERSDLAKRELIPRAYSVRIGSRIFLFPSLALSARADGCLCGSFLCQPACVGQPRHEYSMWWGANEDAAEENLGKGSAAQFPSMRLDGGVLR